ncbi:hypothetical protein BaRGS_00037983 [Batillaria attramentaria]|uniref:Uncharacterized protein n=1 Tax=Batillaria attramentaria TaxID=370345 RepID=A0ABD0J7J8_9CAEN
MFQAGFLNKPAQLQHPCVSERSSPNPCTHLSPEGREEKHLPRTFYTDPELKIGPGCLPLISWGTCKASLRSSTLNARRKCKYHIASYSRAVIAVVRTLFPPPHLKEERGRSKGEGGARWEGGSTPSKTVVKVGEVNGVAV